MDNIPDRTKLASYYRSILNRYEKRLVLPVYNPSFYQIVAIFLSIFLMFMRYKPLIVLIVLLVLFSDWFDGAAARKKGLDSRMGWMIDVVVDRISEGFMFISILNTCVGKVFFFAYLINILLSFYSVKTGRHLLVPVRFIYLAYIVLTLPLGFWI